MAQPPARATPAVGLAILTLIVLGVAGWMSQQGRRALVPPATGTAGAVGARDVEGFRSDAWYLPDAPRLGFVEVPAGPFLMGSDAALDPDAFDNEHWPPDRAPGTLELPAYYIGRFEVTVAQFQAFVLETHYGADPQALQGRPDHPVVAVSWPDALAYCRWLDGRLRESPTASSELAGLLDRGWHVTLPSEAQWEKAARGTDGRIYPWGDRPRRDRANYGGTATSPVGRFPCPECPYGLRDMSGNVWEWTASPYQPYPYDPADDRLNLDADALWVMRGGHFGDSARYVRAAARGGADPGVHRPFIGFRLSLSAGSSGQSPVSSRLQ